MINLVFFLGGPDDQKCIQRVLLGSVVWGSEKLFLRVLTKNKIFINFLLRILCWFRILYKISKNMKVWQGVKDRVNSIFSNLPFYFYNLYFIITLLFIFILTFYPILYLKLCNLSLRHYSILNKHLQKLKLKTCSITYHQVWELLSRNSQTPFDTFTKVKSMLWMSSKNSSLFVIAPMWEELSNSSKFKRDWLL